MVDSFLVIVTDLYKVNKINRDILRKVANKLTILRELSSTLCSS